MHIYLSQPEFCILTRNHAKTPQHAIANKKKKKKIVDDERLSNRISEAVNCS